LQPLPPVDRSGKRPTLPPVPPKSSSGDEDDGDYVLPPSDLPPVTDRTLQNLQSLEYRRISQDLMLCYQILHGCCDTTIASCFVHRSDDSTRGNQLKLRPDSRQKTSSSAVAKRPRDASCLSVVSFNSTKRRVESFIVSYT